jgi:hypothetical protein
LEEEHKNRMEELNTDKLRDLRNELEIIEEEPLVDDYYEYKNQVHDQIIVKKVL